MRAWARASDRRTASDTTTPAAMNTSAATTQGQGLHSSTHDELVVVLVQMLPGPSRFSHATNSSGSAGPAISAVAAVRPRSRLSSTSPARPTNGATKIPMVIMARRLNMAPAPTSAQATYQPQPGSFGARAGG